MFFLNDLKNFKIYKKRFLLPIDNKDKRKGSVAVLLGTDFKSSVDMINHPLFINKYFNSYYMEQAALYYINQDNKVVETDAVEEEVTESLIYEGIGDILDDNKRRFIFSGYETDQIDVIPYINMDLIKDFSGKYGTALRFPVYINVYRKMRVPATTSDTISIVNKSTLFKHTELKDYQAYLRYETCLMILNRSKKEVNSVLKVATALYESDLYSICKANKHWIFKKDLKKFCQAIETYIRKYGYDRYRRKILEKNDIAGLFKTVGLDLVLDSIPKNSMINQLWESDIEDSFDSTREFVYESAMNEAESDNSCIFISEDAVIVHEDAKYNSILKKFLFKDRMRKPQEVLDVYAKIKESSPKIKYSYRVLDRYTSRNLFYDTHHYFATYIKNSNLRFMRGFNVLNDLMDRLINDKRLDKQYNTKTVIVPVLDWDYDKAAKMWMIQQSVNPVSCIFQMISTNPKEFLNRYGDINFLFLGDNAYFKVKFNEVADLNSVKTLYIRLIKRLRVKGVTNDAPDDEPEVSQKVIAAEIIDKVEKSQGVEINDISGEKDPSLDISADIDAMSKAMPTMGAVRYATKPKRDITRTVIKKATVKKTVKKQQQEKDKQDLVAKINTVAAVSDGLEDTLDNLDTDAELKDLLIKISEEPDNKPSVSPARASRIIKLNNDIVDKEFKDKTIKELLEDEPEELEIPKLELDVDSVNDGWKDLTFTNRDKVYDPDKDIVQMFMSFSDPKLDNPLSIVSIDAEDTSNSEDAIETYTVRYEDKNGKRFTVKLDVPIFIDNKYMKLRGNRKDISSQLFLMPICKTAPDTVQIVSNYRKITVTRFGTTSGKSNVWADKLIKCIKKNNFKSITTNEGDNTRICMRYELPIDYVDIASVYSNINTPTLEIFFNQKEFRDRYKDRIDLSHGIPFGLIKNGTKKDVLYFTGKDGNNDITFSEMLVNLLAKDRDLSQEGFLDKFNSTAKSVRYTYSKASMAGTNIPLVVVAAFTDGLVSVLKKANIEFSLKDTKKGFDPLKYDFVKFEDGFVIYKNDYSSSLLMNGLKACNTEDYSISKINDRFMYLDFLDSFGGRSRGDDLDNFANLMIDKPITVETLKYYKLPTDYVEVLLYANRLLADNKFVKHTSITDNRRIRRAEQIPAILYQVLSTEYGRYCNQVRHGRTAVMSIKQSAVIDNVLKNPTTTDNSIINPLNEFEAYNSVTAKGPSGMNSDRAYTLDKRAFDPSMMGVLGMSTGFAANSGVTRQATIDANTKTVRGYIVDEDQPDELDAVKDFSMTEALTPYGSTRDDPFRTAMTFLQTSKHAMRTKKSHPSLITTGADEALPKMISNTFAKKADKPGKIVEIDEEKVIIEYDDGTFDYVDLENHVEKNSSSGFFVNLKLDTDLKVGNKVKPGDIVAYDKLSFSNSKEFGSVNDIAYNIGTLSKFAISNTDEGYEDSAIISEKLCEDMISEVVLQSPSHPITIDCNANVYNLVKKGQAVEEGDVLLTLQASGDEDASELLRNLTDDEGVITELGRRSITSKVTGVVEDIFIYRTVDIQELSPTLKKIVTDYEKKLNQKKATMKKYGIGNPDLTVGSTSKLKPTGKLKNAENAVVIEIYIRYEDRMKVGDKIVYYSALKGVIKDIFPEGKEPTSEFRPNEKLDSLLAIGSVNGRMVGSIIINGAISKYLIELSRKCKDILGIKYPDNIE